MSAAMNQLAGVVGVLALVYGLLSTPNFVRDAVFGQAPANSSLANFGWPPAFKVSEEHVKFFDDHGFVVLRRAVDPIVVELMAEEAVRGCSWQLFLTRFCYMRQTRWSVDLFRDFLFHGPVGEIAQAFLRKKGVRVLQDGIFGVRRTWNPLVFSFLPHVDHGGNPGIYGRLHSNATGISVWMPLQDINATEDGGSLVVYEGFMEHNCHAKYGSVITDNMKVLNHTQLTFACHIEALKKRQVVLHFNKGDLLLFSPNMLHNTQLVESLEKVRYAWHAWLADSDATSCFVRDCWNRAEPCCSAELPKPGGKIHTPCYAQIWPQTLPHEVAAHFEDRPQPLVTWRPKRDSGLLELNHACSQRHRVIS